MRHEPNETTVTSPEIAIIGMGCMFPGAPNLAAYWQNIVSKVDAITDPPPEAWDSDLFYDPSSTENDRVYCKRGGYLGPQAYFNPLSHGIMPRAVEGGEPDQWLALQVATDALADAGYPDGPPERHQTAVILGKGTYINRGNLTMVQHSLMVDQTLQALKTLQPELTDEQLRLVRQDLKRQLPVFNTETASAMVPNIVAGRIANRLDLMGPSYTVDAACASSLIALEMAVRGLRNHEYDMALAGGVQVTTPIPILTLFSQLKALSLGEQIRPFDEGADGTILSEGLGIVVLKRLADARRDGDRVYAVIKGVGVASDGKGTSVLAPRVEGEELALRRAFADAGVSPRSVGLIEAHGTATLVGDAAEIAALTRVFGERDGALPWSALGTVKSMIGHTMPAAGIAGVIKAALALHQKVLPPTLHVDQPSPKLELEKTPFYLNTEARPWIHAGADAPRRAGVNAFGFGGINAHTLLEEFPVADELAEPSYHLHWETEVCILEGDGRSGLLQKGHELVRFLKAAADVPLKDVAYSLNTQLGTVQSESQTRLAIVASSIEDLRQKLEQALERLADPAQRKIKARNGVYFFDEPLARDGKLAFLFPGEGAQYVNMLSDLCLHFPEVRQCFDAIDRVYADHARGYVPSDFIFPRPSFSDEERKAAEDQIWRMDVAIESLLTANQALFTLLDNLGIQPDALLGHSTGEYSAMRAGGMLGAEASFGRRLIELNRLYEGAAVGHAIPKAKLLAVGAHRDQVLAATATVDGELYAAMDNCAHQVVLVGSPEVSDRAAEQLQRQGLMYEVLSFDRAYHTPLFEPYAEVLRDFLARWIDAPPRVPLYSCTTTELFPADLPEIRRIAFEHWCRSVEFRRTIEKMYDDGVRLFVEVGPRGNLTAFVDDILRGRPYLAAPANVLRRSGVTQLNHLLGLLAAHGVPMQLEPLYARRAPRKLDLGRLPTSEDTKQRTGQVQLATGWPPMAIAGETAAKIREELRGAKGAVQPAPLAAAPASVVHQPAAIMEQPPAPPATSAPPVAEQDSMRQDTSYAVAPQPVAPVAPAMVPAAAPAGADQVVSSYLRTMETFLAVQQDVMQAYLSGGAHAMAGAAGVPAALSAPPEPVPAAAPVAILEAPAAVPLVTVRVEPEAAAPPAVEPLVAAPAPVAAPEPAPTRAAEAPGQVLLRLVSERTGYPTEMLSLDLDLEADLGVDSIKRVEILGAFQRETGSFAPGEMDQLTSRRTLQAMIDFLTARDAPAPASTEGDPARPFVKRVTRLVPGEHAEVLCEISLAAYPFLRHHTLGRDVSRIDPEATGLAVMPFTMSMEMLAEAAELLQPGKVVVGMKELRAYRWIPLERDHVTVTLVATRRPAAAHEVQVQICETGSDANVQPLAEGTIIFADRYADAPIAEALRLRDERPSRWTPERLYREGMFHGPDFRGVSAMGRSGADGGEAALETLPRAGLFAGESGETLLTDPVLLDQPGQALAFWMAEHLERGYVIFPFHLQALHLYGPPLPVGEKLLCQIRVTHLDDLQVRSDLDIVRADGRIWGRLVGWEDRRFDVPTAFFRLLLAPQATVLSKQWAAPVEHVASAQTVAYRLGLDDFPAGFFTAYGGIWQRVLLHLILTKRERELWHNLRTPAPRRLEWLLGRWVAKDAVRQFLLAQHDLALCPADIEILPNAAGQPVVGGRWTEQVARPPLLSLSHTAGIAVALVGDDAGHDGLGIDIEVIGHMNADVARVAFTAGEEQLLATLNGADRKVWELRCWCAKEAVAKAIGLGLVDGPQALVVEELDIGRGAVRLRPSEGLAHRMGVGADVALTALTTFEGGVVTATALYTVEGRVEEHGAKP